MLDGFRHLPAAFDHSAQRALVADIDAILRRAPWYRPTMPRTGKPFSVEMTNAGPLGWVSDREGGYRYQPTHPVTKEPWPPIPPALIRLWNEVGEALKPPQACLVNLYRGRARLGSHVDRDEADLEAPVVSVSLGDDAIFHIGGARRSDPKVRLRLASGDVVVLAGAARLAHHGIDRIEPGTSHLIVGGGRINLTLRHVGSAAAP
ncbi:MAG: alpha-ketoglutarate-dependent dioxygenase AlkB [Hyphomicrobiaceae bacterium]|nr:alpha-ketoglutarate-dependent dioxygenase AlkB [Hyphomicrobiaceae bacterium]